MHLARPTEWCPQIWLSTRSHDWGAHERPCRFQSQISRIPGVTQTTMAFQWDPIHSVLHSWIHKQLLIDGCKMPMQSTHFVFRLHSLHASRTFQQSDKMRLSSLISGLKHFLRLLRSAPVIQVVSSKNVKELNDRFESGFNVSCVSVKLQRSCVLVSEFLQALPVQQEVVDCEVYISKGQVARGTVGSLSSMTRVFPNLQKLEITTTGEGNAPPDCFCIHLWMFSHHYHIWSSCFHMVDGPTSQH